MILVGSVATTFQCMFRDVFFFLLFVRYRYRQGHRRLGEPFWIPRSVESPFGSKAPGSLWLLSSWQRVLRGPWVLSTLSWTKNIALRWLEWWKHVVNQWDIFQYLSYQYQLVQHFVQQYDEMGLGLHTLIKKILQASIPGELACPVYFWRANDESQRLKVFWGHLMGKTYSLQGKFQI